MTSVYHFENFDISKNIAGINDYLKTEANAQQLHEVEHSLFKLLLDMGKSLLNQFLEKKLVESKSSNIIKDNQTLPLQSIKKRNYLSIFGNIKIARAYFWKQGCLGVFPMDAELNMPKHLHSHLLDKWIQHRVTEGPYEESIDSICDLLDLKVSKRLVQQITDQASQYVENYYQQKPSLLNEGSHLVVQADCKGVRMISKERPETKIKKEFERRAKGVSKIGTRKNAVITSDYSINPSLRTYKDVLDGLMAINSNKKILKQKEIKGDYQRL